MSTPTLHEAHRRFAAVLDELRRKYVAEFDLWLKNALAANVADAREEAPERIAHARRRFADEFLDQRAPAIVHDLNSGAEYTILETLRSYDARPEIRQPPAAPVNAPWLRGLWRIVFAAAFGAAAGVIVLTLQHAGGIPKAPPAISQPGQPAQPGQPGQPPAAPKDAPQVQAAETSPPPPPPTQQPAPPSNSSAELFWWLLQAVFVAALGSAFGVFLIASPPVEALFERLGLRHMWRLPIGWRLGVTFAFLRAGPLMTLMAVLLSGLFGLIAWLVGAGKPLPVLVAFSALAIILSLRWTAPPGGGRDPDTLQRTLLAQLDEALKTDANAWAALAAGLVLQRGDGPAPRRPELQEITNIILSRRANKESSDDILRIVEQRLGIRGDGKQQPQMEQVFTWKPEHEQYYETFGLVEPGVIVAVSQQPLLVEGAGGSWRVSKKGLVAPKD